jgi:hypothetical protein
MKPVAFVGCLDVRLLEELAPLVGQRCTGAQPGRVPREIVHRGPDVARPWHGGEIEQRHRLTVVMAPRDIVTGRGDSGGRCAQAGRGQDVPGQEFGVRAAADPLDDLAHHEVGRAAVEPPAARRMPRRGLPQQRQPPARLHRLADIQAGLIPVPMVDPGSVGQQLVYRDRAPLWRTVGQQLGDGLVEPD